MNQKLGYWALDSGGIATRFPRSSEKWLMAASVAMIDSMVATLTDPFGVGHMGITAENLAVKWGITREEQDAFGVRSQNLAEAAIAAAQADLGQQVVQLAWDGGVSGPDGTELGEAGRTAVSVTLEDGRTVEHRVPLLERGADFALDVPARPLRVAADPRFDLFRHLEPAESPATLSALFGAERGLIVLPDDDTADGYRALANAWAKGAGDWEIVEDGRLAELFVESEEKERMVGDIYLGTVANPGTWRVLVDGSVTREWAKHHHPNWFHKLKEQERVERAEAKYDEQRARAHAASSHRRASMASNSSPAMLSPYSRSSSRMQVGLVTLISVR